MYKKWKINQSQIALMSFPLILAVHKRKCKEKPFFYKGNSLASLKKIINK